MPRLPGELCEREAKADALLTTVPRLCLEEWKSYRCRKRVEETDENVKIAAPGEASAVIVLLGKQAL